MPTCPQCQQSNATRDGHDRDGRQRFTCTDCGRDFTIRSASVFSGYRWPADVILMAVRWHVQLTDVLPAFSASTNRQDHVRTIAAAVFVLGMRLNRKPQIRR
jgi:hypothetical protein